MVLRAVLAVWFLTTSVLGPALCCCTPSSPWNATRHVLGTPATVTPASLPAAEGRCPHCKEKAGQSPAPEKQQPSDSPKPCPGKCPCQTHSLTPAAPGVAGQELRTLVHFNWLPAAPVFGSVFAAHLVVTEHDPRASNLTGPPPLSGVERLHRLHILVC